MRLLIYLLALISGFSAAEAARADVSPASSVAQTAVAAAEALAAQEQLPATRPVAAWPRENRPIESARVLVGLAPNTPIIRHDLSRE
jgi:hypothetical protein